MAKRVLIVAGPNGAGKTTLSLRILAGREDMVFLNADNIAERIASDRPGDIALDAGRQLLVELDRCVADGASFIVEVFLALPTAEMALERVASRVAQGGHDIPADVIRRRFFSGLRNLRELYAPLVDFWQLFDASGPIPRLLEEGP
jgi:predicted ABC-type ATPase